MGDKLVVRGAREHNLKNVDLELPRDRLIAFTGLSGSGKSSLAFDTIYAEGQRRYVESLSSYARQFLQMQEKPDVDGIDGVRVTNDDGWWLLRASNTQDVLVARAESDSEDGLARLMVQIDEQLQLSGLERGESVEH